MKRVADLFGAGLLLLVSMPIILVLGIGLAVSLRAWPVFTQVRIGRDGQPFRFVKLRTLPPDTPRYADKYAISDLELPWLARTVRDLHLDELPQLALVLTGHMSLVGPRPEMPELHQLAPQSFATERTRVRPGCTGLWQISDAAEGLIHEAPLYDLIYVARRSLALDLWILWHTALRVIGRGSPQSAAAIPGWALNGQEDGLQVILEPDAVEPARRQLVQRGESAA